VIAFFHRYLDPAESLAEVLFGLIMVLTCTLGAGVIGSTDQGQARTLLLAAVGCNVAWGVIDAALYVMGNLFVRSQKVRLMRAIQAAPNEAAALAIVEQYFESRIEDLGRQQDRDRLYRDVQGIIARAELRHGRIAADDLRGALAVFLLVVGTALPAAVPFALIADPSLALRISNLVLVALLFIVGFYWARYIGANAWRTGLVMLLSGLVLVGVALALGG
jgi:VIT1/CCC1 family predicted Fe2+/Mn2+ transporter